MNITRQPTSEPTTPPANHPITKVRKEVNSTFGGLGVSCIPIHRGTIIDRKEIFLVFIWYLDGLSIHINFSKKN
jgi:hypothetical protein